MDRLSLPPHHLQCKILFRSRFPRLSLHLTMNRFRHRLRTPILHTTIGLLCCLQIRRWMKMDSSIQAMWLRGSFSVDLRTLTIVMRYSKLKELSLSIVLMSPQGLSEFIFCTATTTASSPDRIHSISHQLHILLTFPLPIHSCHQEKPLRSLSVTPSQKRTIGLRFFLLMCLLMMFSIGMTFSNGCMPADPKMMRTARKTKLKEALLLTLLASLKGRTLFTFFVATDTM